MSDCTGGCEQPARRDFLRGAAVALIAALALEPKDLPAFPISRGAALQRLGDTVSYPLPAADGATIDDENEVILVRWQNAVFAFALSCPHQNTALRWLANDGRFQCPKHKSKYKPDGTFISGRATRNMDRFGIKKDAGKVVVDLNQLYESDKQNTAWAAATVSA